MSLMSDAMFSDLYPERRRSISKAKQQSSLGSVLMGNQRVLQAKRQSCERAVIKSLETMPMIKLLVSALENSGCSFKLSRHISCDTCKPCSDLACFGGYDEVNNQVFVCSNNISNRGFVHGVLLRNLLHMYDACVRKLDFKNVDHLACMEVRKANLANCNYMLYWLRSDYNWDWAAAHKKCVSGTAVDFMVQCRKVERQVAQEAVDRVFSKCYDDLEPIGRRVYNFSDMEMANKEKHLFGY